MKFLRDIIKESAPTNTFTHDYNDYDLTLLNRIIKENSVKKFKVKDLTWIFKYDDPDEDHPERVKTAALAVPIIVTEWEDKLVVLDGLHRLKKAVNQGLESIEGRMVSKSQLKEALVKKEKE